MLIVYNKDSGKIISYFPNECNPLFVYEHYPQEFKDNLAWFEDSEWSKEKYKNCYIDVETKELTRHPQEVIDEKNKYGKILTEEERQALTPTLNDLKNQKISDSKIKLLDYLKQHPLLFSDGKYYNVTQEKQNLLNNAITVYQMKTQLGLPAELKWNSTGEECSVWTLEDAISLALGVASYVEPLVAYQQSTEVQIRNCTTKEELESTVIDYETV